MRRLGNIGEYERIWGNMEEYGGIWEGTFGPKEVAGDSGKLWETYVKLWENGSGRAPSEKVIKPPGEGALPTGLFYPPPDGPLFAPSCSLRGQKFRHDFCSLKVSLK